MNCTACGYDIAYKGGENTKDHGCWNMKCPARVEACYYGNVSVKPDWWFAESYTLPFKNGRQWYSAVGPVYTNFYNKKMPNGQIKYLVKEPITSLQRIDTFYEHNILNWNGGNPIWGDKLTCKQTEVWTVPYMALPVNEDFNREFNVLVNKFDRYLNKLILLK